MDNNRCSPLFSALKFKRYPLVQYLVAQGCDLACYDSNNNNNNNNKNNNNNNKSNNNNKNSNRRTVLHKLAGQGNKEAVEVILEVK